MLSKCKKYLHITFKPSRMHANIGIPSRKRVRITSCTPDLHRAVPIPLSHRIQPFTHVLIFTCTQIYAIVGTHFFRYAALELCQLHMYAALIHSDTPAVLPATETRSILPTSTRHSLLCFNPCLEVRVEGEGCWLRCAFVCVLIILFLVLFP